MHSLPFLNGIFPIQNEHAFEILLILMLAIWISGRIFRAVKLPPVLGEIIAGVILGPLFFGFLQKNEVIDTLAQLGVFFLMLHTGLGTNPKELFSRIRLATMVAIAGIIPLALVAYSLAHLLGFPPMTALFFACVIPLNSIPVIISVLKSFGLHRGKIGHTVFAATVANELLLFVAISLILATAQTGLFSFLSLAVVFFKVVLFFAIALFSGFKILPFASPIFNENGKKGFTFTLIIGLLFGLLAEAIGLHIILGAYLAGMFVRQQIHFEPTMKKIEDRLYGLSYSFLGPIFFALVGMTVSFDVLFENPFFILSLFLVMIGFQLLFSGAAAYLYGKFSAAESALVGLGLVGRGGTEIIVAQIGLSTIVLATGQPLLPNELFSSVVLLAFLTTLAKPFLMRPFVRKLEKEAGLEG